MMEQKFGREFRVLLCAACLFVVVGFSACGADETNAALAYNTLMLDAIRVENTGPTLSTRNLAILHTAIYDAVNSIDRTHQPYLAWRDVPGEVSMEAAATSAGRRVMLVLYPTLAAQTEALHAALIASLRPSAGTTNGITLGREAALASLASRAADGSSTQVPYIPSKEPGQWVRTPPFYRPPLDPHWRYVLPFCLENIEPYVAPGPPALNSSAYARDFNEVKTLGALDSPARTPEQGEIAVFWSDFSYTAMPPGHWHEIAAMICLDRQSDLAESARVLALMSLAQADAAIVCWEGKYRYNLWRPVTAVGRAGEDGNEATEADPDWEALLPAPNFPEYPSGHSTFSTAGAQVLTQFLGTDSITFAARSDALPEVTRTFHSLAACAAEVGMSRIYGGFHFQFANRDGSASGRAVGDFVAANFLLPLSRLPSLGLEGFPGGHPVLRVHGEIGTAYTLEATADFTEWTQLEMVQGRSGGVLVRDPLPISRTGRFYRVVGVEVP